jgi:hypothetical protein
MATEFKAQAITAVLTDGEKNAALYIGTMFRTWAGENPEGTLARLRERIEEARDQLDDLIQCYDDDTTLETVVEEEGFPSPLDEELAESEWDEIKDDTLCGRWETFHNDYLGTIDEAVEVWGPGKVVAEIVALYERLYPRTPATVG